MDEMKEYECPDCGATKKVEAGAEPPVCEGCEVTMEPVAASVEGGGEGELVDELEEDEELE